jgi:hypothetical protein
VDFSVQVGYLKWECLHSIYVDLPSSRAVLLSGPLRHTASAYSPVRLRGQQSISPFRPQASEFALCILPKKWFDIH